MFEKWNTPTATSHGSSLSDVSLRVKRGEIVALVAENGSGRSTLSGARQRPWQRVAGDANTPQPERAHQPRTV